VFLCVWKKILCPPTMHGTHLPPSSPPVASFLVAAAYRVYYLCGELPLLDILPLKWGREELTLPRWRKNGVKITGREQATRAWRQWRRGRHIEGGGMAASVTARRRGVSLAASVIAAWRMAAWHLPLSGCPVRLLAKRACCHRLSASAGVELRRGGVARRRRPHRAVTQRTST